MDQTLHQRAQTRQNTRSSSPPATRQPYPRARSRCKHGESGPRQSPRKQKSDIGRYLMAGILLVAYVSKANHIALIDPKATLSVANWRGYNVGISDGHCLLTLRQTVSKTTSALGLTTL